MPEQAVRPISVLVLDDHALFREGVSRLLTAEDGFDVHISASIDDALEAVSARSFDVVLLDLDLGTRRGTEFVPLARRRGFSGKLLVVAGMVPRDEAASLIRLGVGGIVTKHESPTKLAAAIRDVVADKLYFDPQLLKDVLAAEQQAPRQIAPFTPRERTVLGHVFEGMTNKEIADRIGVSESAIKATLQQLFGKTGVRTRSQLVRIALERYRHQL